MRKEKSREQGAGTEFLAPAVRRITKQKRRPLVALKPGTRAGVLLALCIEACIAHSGALYSAQ